MAPQKLRKAATLTTAVVVPVQDTIVPIQIERINCARKTIELTIATSVPSPLTTFSFGWSSGLISSN